MKFVPNRNCERTSNMKHFLLQTIVLLLIVRRISFVNATDEANWGLPDTKAAVFKCFNYTLLDGKDLSYDVKEAGEETLPSWLYYNAKTKSIEGVPLEKDSRQYFIAVTTFRKSESGGQVPIEKDVISIDVGNEAPSSSNQDYINNAASVECTSKESFTIISVLCDAALTELPPEKRVEIMSKMSYFVNLPISALTLSPYSNNKVSFDSSAVMAGPGNANKQTTAGLVLQWNAGCGGNINPVFNLGLSQIEISAKDGSLSSLLDIPVVGWFVTSQTLQQASRNKRQIPIYGTPIPGIVPSIWHSLISMEPTDETIIPETRVIPTMASPSYTLPSHHHRHHHGEGTHPHRHMESISSSQTLQTFHPPTNQRVLSVISTPTLVPDRPTKWIQMSTIEFEPSRALPEEITPLVGLASSFSMPVSPTSETEALPSFTAVESSESEMTTQITPTPAVDFDTTIKPSGVANFKPTVHNRVKKLSMIAGKVWSYQIPSDTFVDFEDGDTRKLKLIFMTKDRTAIPTSYWIQFDPEKQTLYALPTEKDVGKYEFVLEAMDSESESTYDRLEIHVWQHASARAFHHTISMKLKFNKWQFPVNIDWQIEVVKRLALLYGDDDPSYVTVQTVSQEHMISWTNDSLSGYPCPRDEINKLLEKLTGEGGEVSKPLKKVMGQDFRIQSVTITFHGVCHTPVSTTSSPLNMAPLVRNPIQPVNCTVGNILRYKIPEDTFYDTEDGDTRHLSLTLLTIDSVRPPKSSWVQFDQKSQELYGLPFEGNEGRHEYQIVAQDTQGVNVNDVFVIVVAPRPPKKQNVEFSVHLDYNYDSLNEDISKKVLVAWRLARVFGDHDPRFITVNSITKGSVVYAWTNNTLPIDICPKETIKSLVKYLFTGNGTLAPRLVDGMKPEFKVIKADAMPLGICLGEVTPTSVTIIPPGDRPETVDIATYDDDDIYITTIIPAIVIVIMLVIAGLVACFLYQRKRKGKLSMKEGLGFHTTSHVPVVFDGEYDDKSDPAKAPVIMKQERPPLAPPDYPRYASASSREVTPYRDRRAGPDHYGPRHDINHDMHDPSTSPPYQPPPPFMTNRECRNTRPKVAKSYHHPPPYVPP